MKDLTCYGGQTSQVWKNMPGLKNSVAQVETLNEKIVMMMDMGSVEKAVDLGARICDDASSF